MIAGKNERNGIAVSYTVSFSPYNVFLLGLHIMFHVFSCLLGFIMIYPLLWLVASSFKSNDTVFKNTYSLLPESWGIIKNYTSGFAGTAGYS